MYCSMKSSSFLLTSTKGHSVHNFSAHHTHQPCTDHSMRKTDFIGGWRWWWCLTAGHGAIFLVFALSIFLFLLFLSCTAVTILYRDKKKIKFSTVTYITLYRPSWTFKILPFCSTLNSTYPVLFFMVYFLSYIYWTCALVQGTAETIQKLWAL